MTDTIHSSPSGHDGTGTPSVAEIAALTARLRAMSAAGAAADPAERVAFLADGDALIDRITTAGDLDRTADREDADRSADTGRVGGEGRPARDYGSFHGDAVDISARLGPAAELGMAGAEGPPIGSGPTRSAQVAAHELAADGFPLDEARALVGDYLDKLCARVGVPACWWGLDDADLTAIRAAAGDPVARARAAVTALPTDDTTARDDAAPTATVPADETANDTADEAAAGIDRGAQGWSR